MYNPQLLKLLSKAWTFTVFKFSMAMAVEEQDEATLFTTSEIRC
jgi:hypothetical protein